MSAPALAGRRPEPVLDQAKVVATVTSVSTALLTLAAVGGLLTLEQIDGVVVALVSLAGAVVTVVNLVVPLVRARIARAQVTPLSSPHDADGSLLVSVKALPQQTGQHLHAGMTFIGTPPAATAANVEPGEHDPRA